MHKSTLRMFIPDLCNCALAFSYRALSGHHHISCSKRHINPEYDKAHIISHISKEDMRRYPKLGKLDAQIRLDERARTVYGSTGPATGSLVLKYLPYEKAIFKWQSETVYASDLSHTNYNRVAVSFPKVTEKSIETVPLCGTITATVILRGMFRYKTRIFYAGGQGGSQMVERTYDKQLCQEQVVVCVGWISATVGDEFTCPFSIQFPHAQRMPPLTFTDHMRCSPETIIVGVEYRLGLQLQVDGASPQMNDTWWDGHPSINYQLAQPPEDFFASTLTTSTHQSKIRSWLLLPPEQRRSEWKAKAKAKGRPHTMPILTMDISCTTCSHSYPGQVLDVTITVRKNDMNSTAESMPDIVLVGVRTKLMAQIRVTEPDRRGESCVQELSCRNEFPILLCSQNNRSATVTLDPLDQHSCSFSFD